MDQAEAEQALRNHLRLVSRDAADALAAEPEAHEEGWVFYVSPADLYFGRAMPFRTVTFFVDASDGRVHVVPSYGLRLLLAKLRGRI